MFVFTSIGCINGSFTNKENPDCFLVRSGISMDDCMHFFNAINESSCNKQFNDTVRKLGLLKFLSFFV